MADSYDLYFSADIETDGPIPGRYSMLAFGLVVAGRYDGRKFEAIDPSKYTFYRELQPIADDFDRETLEVSGLDRQRLMARGTDPATAMTEASDWVRSIEPRATPILAAYPLGFDWPWLYWYFVQFSRTGSPFDYSSCLDMKTVFSMVSGRPFAKSGKSKLPPGLRSTRAHTHHALDDAKEQADIFVNLVRAARG